jgi:hypothetical protein
VIVPTVVLPPTTLFTVHVKAEDGDATPVNCWVVPVWTLTLVGVTVTVTDGAPPVVNPRLWGVRLVFTGGGFAVYPDVVCSAIHAWFARFRHAVVSDDELQILNMNRWPPGSRRRHWPPPTASQNGASPMLWCSMQNPS